MWQEKDLATRNPCLATAQSRGLKTTNLAQPGAIVHGGFGGGEVSLGDLRPRGAFPGMGRSEGVWVAAGGGGSEGYAAGGGSLGLGIGV